MQQTVTGNWVKEQSLPGIEEDAERAARAFCRFREMQTRHNMNADEFVEAKSKLRERFDDLREELDRYLADEYGVKPGDERAFRQWHDSHQPFHWFVEFYGIMHSGGFDVTPGNPPYVEYSKIKTIYQVNGFTTNGSGNIYAFCTERALALSHSNARLDFIVPISLQTTTRMKRLQGLLADKKRLIYLSAFDVYPSKLFEGAKQRLCIVIVSERAKKSRFWTTPYNRWKPNERSTLFANLHFHQSYLDRSLNLIPKLGHAISRGILSKLNQFEPIPYKNRPESPSFYVHRIPYNYTKAFDFVPYFWSENRGQKKSEDYKPYQLTSSENSRAILAALNSSIFFWWWYSLFEGYHCGHHEIAAFPIGIKSMRAEVHKLLVVQADRLMNDYKYHCRRRTANYKATGKVEYDEFYPRQSKKIIDEIDLILAQHYGLSNVELDYIINFDAKYRFLHNSSGS